MFTDAECYTFGRAVKTIAKTLVKRGLGFFTVTVINKRDLLTRAISSGSRFNVSLESTKDRREFIFFKAIREVTDVKTDHC